MADLIVQPAVRKTRVPGFRHYLADERRSDQVKRIEAVGVRADGCEFPLELSIAEVDVPGDPLHTVYVRDITDQKLREAALLESEAIVGSSFEAIVGRTVDGIITSWNAAAERIFGYTADEVLGGVADFLVVPDSGVMDYVERAPDPRRGGRADRGRLHPQGRQADRRRVDDLADRRPLRRRHRLLLDHARHHRAQALAGARRGPGASCSSSWPGALSCRVVLDHLARFVEEHGDDVLASILLLDADGVHLRHGAAPSLPASYCEAIDGIAIGPSVGSCGTAAFRRERVCVSDISTDPLWRDYRELALEAGLQACWSTPDLRDRRLGAGHVRALLPRAPGGRRRRRAGRARRPRRRHRDRSRALRGSRACERGALPRPLRERERADRDRHPGSRRSLEVNSGLRAHARLHARRADRHEPGRLPDARIDRDVDARDASASSRARSRARSTSRSSSPGTGTP